MKEQINPTSRSKIAHTAGIQSAFNVLVYIAISRGVIPEEAAVDALLIANTVSGGLIYVFRRWFTVP